MTTTDTIFKRFDRAADVALAVSQLMTFHLKDEGLNDNGQLVGPLYQRDKPWFTDGRWVTYPQAVKIAASQNAALEII